MPPMQDASVSFLVRKLHATVAPEIAAPVAFFTAVSVLVVVLSKTLNYNLSVNTVALSVLSTMISFAISLRTSSALDRYNEGRRAWSQISLASRNLAILIWMQLPATTLHANELQEAMLDPHRMEHEKAKGLIEKRTVINLLEAFAVSAKHYLRGEGGVYYEDLYHLVAPLPKYAYTAHDAPAHERRASVLGLWRQPNDEGLTPLPANTHEHGPHCTDLSSSTDSKGSTAAMCRHTLRPAFNPPPKTIYDWFFPALLFRPFVRWFATSKAKRARAAKKREKMYNHTAGNVPLELSLFINGWIAAVIKRKTIEASFISVVHTATNSLQEAVTTLERVSSTPLPYAYQAHLRFSIYIFLLLLPFQIYESLGWLAIVATAVTSTIYLGFLEIATQIENPFGYDESDLDLDHLCALIAAELREIVAHPQPEPDSFVLSPLNQPFLPTDTRSASEILAHLHPTYEHPSPASPEEGGEKVTRRRAEGSARGEMGLRRLAANHFHRMDGLGKIEEDAQEWGLHEVEGSGRFKGRRQRSVDVLMV